MKIMKKLLKIPFFCFGYLLYFCSFLIKRDDNLWVFGSYGDYNDNSRYLYDFLRNDESYNIRCVWISSRKKSVLMAMENGGEAYYTWSLKGIYYALIAKVFVFSSYISDINMFASGGAILVNLWHGIPLKKIEFDIDTGPLAKVFKRANLLTRIRYPAQHRKLDFVLAPSQYIAEYSFISAFRLRGMQDIIISSYPRVEDLLRKASCEKLEKKNFSFLYAPTWRDTDDDFFSVAGIDLNILNQSLIEMDAIFFLKFHANTKISIDVEVFSNIFIIDNKQDPNEILSQADCLITDYSSIYFDYSYLDRDVIFYPFDLLSFTRNREMYITYDEYAVGPKAMSFDELISMMKLVRSNHFLGIKSFKKNSSKFISEFVGYKNLVDKILEKNVKNNSFL
ncbi:CDP-glycerol glycerophosphotransferase family protein [Citrobacter portucalensis]|uniref:CDP-glycerol glycerophosphotransferase family protein n=1 Tax=Citrobacter portucalensis TaxID=1639133 RepID=UPI00254D38E6|nr:CDP-glycerol glycerophosphotransferase family protein [Citrobacter portucalensis]